MAYPIGRFFEIPGLSNLFPVTRGNLAQIEHLLSPIARPLVQDFESGSISREEATHRAQLLIADLSTHDIPILRHVLCSLLHLNIEEIQLKVMQDLKPHLNIERIGFDRSAHQCDEFTRLELLTRVAIDIQIQRNASKRLLASFLILYEDIYENLWIFSCFLPLAGHLRLLTLGMTTVQTVKHWLQYIDKTYSDDNDIYKIVNNLNKFIQTTLSSIANGLLTEFLINNSNVNRILVCVSEIYAQAQYFQRATYHLEAYLKNIRFFERVECEEVDEPERKIAFDFGKLCLAIARTYSQQGEYDKAHEHCDKSLKIFKALKDLSFEGISWTSKGNIFRLQHNLDEALNCYNTHLRIAAQLKELHIEAALYCDIGICHQFQGELSRAVQYFQRALDLHVAYPQEMNSGGLTRMSGELARVHRNLGATLLEQGSYQQAYELYTKSLAECRANSIGKQMALNGLGLVHFHIREYDKAIECFTQAMELARNLDRPVEFQRAVDNLVTAKDYKKDGKNPVSKKNNTVDPEFIEFHKKRVQRVKQLNDPDLLQMAYGDLGLACAELGNHDEAIKNLETQLELATKINNPKSRFAAHGNLGNTYREAKNYNKARFHMEESLKISESRKFKIETANSYLNLGKLEIDTNDIALAEEHTRKTIGLYYELTSSLEDIQAKIRVFEMLSKAYVQLEVILLDLKRYEQALEVHELAHSGVLISTLGKRFSHLNIQPRSLTNFLSYAQIKQLAVQRQTTFVIYLWSTSIEDRKKSSETIGIYVVTPNPHEKMIVERSPIALIREEIEDIKTFFEQFPYNRTGVEEAHPESGQARGGDSSTVENPRVKKARELALRGFKKKLENWHRIFIAPIQHYLPQDTAQTVTFVTDDFLSQLPFAIFQDEAGKYLIEKHPISSTSSIEVLDLLSRCPNDFSSERLIIGNPQTKNPKDELKLAEEEAQIVAELLKVPQGNVLVKDKSTPNTLKKEIPRVASVHFACHGEQGYTPRFEPHTIFKGRLKLAPDEEHSEGHLYATEITNLKLNADLIFLSSCYSGVGEIEYEGSIGFVWSFLAGGARSVIASHWKVPETSQTLQMIKTFYQNYHGISCKKLNKAQALREALLLGLTENRGENPHAWGMFFLSGLD